MIFRQGGQGPCAGMVLVGEFVLLACLVLAGSSCSTKVVSSRTPVFSHDAQNSSVPAAQCFLSRPDTHPKVNYSFMPPQADMGALVSQREGEPASGSSDFDDSAFSFEEVEDVPSISDIVLAQYDDWRGYAIALAARTSVVSIALAWSGPYSGTLSRSSSHAHQRNRAGWERLCPVAKSGLEIWSISWIGAGIMSAWSSMTASFSMLPARKESSSPSSTGIGRSDCSVSGGSCLE